MATWAIGDVHGCFRTLEALLERLDLDVRRDRLWLVGDLVNRGPRSLEVLRWARRLERTMAGRFRTVLGNHDLHLIARWLGLVEEKPGDTLNPILDAPDAPDLIAWLRKRPFVHVEPVGGRGHVLVHAGIPPGESPQAAVESSRRLERLLQGSGAARLLSRTGRAAPAAASAARRHPDGRGPEGPEERASTSGTMTSRDRNALAAFTRMRMLDGSLRLAGYNGTLEEAPAGLRPWFEMEPRGCAGQVIVCGHWAALGLRLQEDLAALDSGCVWGGRLAALRLDDRTLVEQNLVDRV